MTSVSDIIRKLLQDNGYNNYKEFCEVAKVSYSNFKKSMCLNKWYTRQLEKIGDAFGVNLTRFANTNKKYD